ncbi:MAG: dihydropteroate synthase, partial [Schwartzia sp.]|nr:dihydropteroate synthase [Schwartzia sp. (in: firmicutes)]
MKNTYRKYVWKDGKILEYGKRTLVMGILNVTPDSFSDGGLWNSPERALRHALQMVDDGADIIDVGAESSRPGFVPMPAEEEMERLQPYLELL